MSLRTPARRRASRPARRRPSRATTLGIIAGAFLLGLVVIGFMITVRFSTAEDRRVQAADTASAAQVILSRLPAEASDTEALITTVMPRLVDAERLTAEIAAVASEFALEIIDTEEAWQTQLHAGREISYAEELLDDLGLADLRARQLIEPVSVVVSVAGALDDITAMMTALSVRDSAEPTTAQLFIRRSDVVLSFDELGAVATFDVIGIALTALPAELRVLIGDEEQ